MYVLFVNSCGCFWFVDVFMVMLLGKISWHSSSPCASGYLGGGGALAAGLSETG